MGRLKKSETTDAEIEDDDAVDDVPIQSGLYVPPDHFWRSAALCLMRWAMMPHNIVGVLQAIRREHGPEAMEYFGQQLSQIRPEMTGPMRAAKTLMARNLVVKAVPLPPQLTSAERVAQAQAKLQ